MSQIDPIGRPIIGIGLLATVAMLLLGGCQKPGPLLEHKETRSLMGTLVSITVEGPDLPRLQQATDAAYREMSRLSDMMNHYNPASVVSEINRSAGIKPVMVPPELMHVLESAQHMSERSHGAFDITVGSLQGWSFNPAHPAMPSPKEVASMLPLVDYHHLQLDEAKQTAFLEKKGMRIDLGGIAKLYILHAGIETLKRNQVTHAMINGGGDVEVIGTIQGRPWRIGIRDARHPDTLFATLDVERGFVDSSGDYERYFLRDGKRYHHILDPKTGYPTQGPHGVTLVGEDLEMLNGLSAAIMVMGAPAGRTMIEQVPSLEGIIFDRDGSVWVSPGLNGRLHMVDKR